MPASEVLDLASRHVPGAGPVELHRLRAGLVNDSYRVLRDGRAFALRVAAANPAALGIDWRWELQVLERAAAQRLAPAVEFADAERGILVLEWIDGRSWSAAEAPRAESLRRIARLLRRIHAIPAPRPARLMRPAQWIELYASPARGPGAALVNTARVKLAALEASPPVAPTVCHSDLHVFNLVDRGDELLLLDWEYAHVSDPLWDVAGWSANNDFTEAEALELLTEYAGRMPRPEEWSRLQILSWLYDYVCLLWSSLYLSLRGGADAQDPVAARAQALQHRLARTK